MSGYLNAEAATAETLVDGWLRTGDIGYIEDGNVFMIDRAKASAFFISPTYNVHILSEVIPFQKSSNTG